MNYTRVVNLSLRDIKFEEKLPKKKTKNTSVGAILYSQSLNGWNICKIRKF